MARIVWANTCENIFDHRFLDALVIGNEVYVVFFKRKGNRLIPPTARVVELWDPPLLPLPFYMTWILKTLLRALIFRRHIKKIKPDLLIGCWITGTYCICSALSGYHPFLAIVYGSDILLEAKNSRVLRLVAKYTLKKADAVIVDSEVQKMAAIKLGCDEKKIWAFPWGIELDKFNPTVNGSEIRGELGWKNNPIIISTRKHFPIYGVEDLIKAIPLVVERVHEARFLIVGYGTLTEKLKGIAFKLGVERYVHFAGRVPNQDMPKYLNAADVYVSTSLSDGASASLLEAMACGLPVVVTDIPANKEWVTNEMNGALVPIKNSKSLAEKIILILKNERLRKIISMNNIEVAKARADWKKNVEIFYNAIQALIKASKHCN